ncbi:hypothetical protein [Vibrio campbellii]|uniref:hypothetical protein n=1 Tax=Vibrio campbellii TaxID=680 RepID=UPI00210CAD5D|nr:hypothetical protein [Vibrio campbellii]UTZ44535.1 hypothetical protein HB764_25070 [Vibrio campbellii]
MASIDTAKIKQECMTVSPLINEVSFCSCIDKCKNPTVYIKHIGVKSSHYHCSIVSGEGLWVNSNGYHPFEVHNAMNEAIKVAMAHMGLE